MCEQTAELVNQLRSGCEPARDKLIIFVTPQAAAAVRRDVKGATDDAVSEATVSVVRAVDLLATNDVKPEAAKAWLIETAKNAARDAVAETGFGPCARHLRRGVVDAPSLEYSPPAYLVGPVVADPYALIDLVDELRACCETDGERDALELLIVGNTFSEIAEALGVDASTVSRRISSIRNRYTERDNDA